MRTAIIVLVAYIGLVAMLFTTQRALQYPASARVTDVEEAQLTGFSDVVITTEDGEQLRAFWKPPEEGRTLVLYFHGNGGSLWNRRFRAQALAEEGRGVLMVSYRGYSGSTGSPTEEGLHADARAAYAFARAHADPARILAYGESLGTGVVMRLASDNPLGAIVLDAPFTSTTDVAARLYPIVPVRFLMLDQFRSIDLVDDITAPALIMHGRRDQVVPFADGRALYEALPGPKRLLAFPESGHVSLFEDGGREAVRMLMEGIENGDPAARLESIAL
ncbi:alpha/beta hydrolase [Saliniramus sp.]|uniref:alpha/beta hydrolase n=1 Tax=Saliniramus sp. TaxID=2986772 RepID=UPI002C0D86CA|nr:alpha/beta hydrolase [Saliniramus sp.]HMB12326.1 alpha/beta hydrolase [Saliniramus sp.]